MSDCLTPAEIEEFWAGVLSPQEKQRAQDHLSACDTCRKRVQSLQSNAKLFGQIKSARQAETMPQPAGRGGASPTDPPITEQIEGYAILREIHRGGQGVVYKALQKATKRTVALKVLLQGLYATAKQRHRFEREIDLVASLQHPNIVTVYDSGLTQGRHYFAMEYIHGQPLDMYLSAKTLTIDETLRLFRKICSAVNYAHQRGVIHRDLKPGNILVDATGEPHVLDFGLAKTAGSSLAGSTLVSVTGEFMGTLAYASPEQTQGDPNQIDIRTDVYSLGVILYEMLTGKYPYEVVGQMAEVLRNIADAEPRKPSTIRRQINDEVETIVLKALAKEKDRRYQSADTLAKDIEHYLAGEPIEAKRDSGWYVLRMTLRRYKTMAMVATAFTVVTIGFLAVVLWERARSDEARAQKTEAETLRDIAVTKMQLMQFSFPYDPTYSGTIELHRSIDEARDRNRCLRDLVSQGEQVLRNIADPESLSDDQVRFVEQELAKLSSENARLSRQLDRDFVEAREEAAKAQQAHEEPTVQLEGEAPTKEVTVVECDGSKYRAGRWDAAAKKIRLDRTFSNVFEFLAWTQDKNPDHDSFTFVIRPAGAAEKGYLEALQTRGFDIGWDPMPDGKEIFAR